MEASMTPQTMEPIEINQPAMPKRFGVLSALLSRFLTATFFALLLSLIFSQSASAQDNQPPVARIVIDPSHFSPIPGFPDAVRGGATITLDGSTSSDPDGDDAALTYLWEPFPRDDSASGITLSDATAARPTFTMPPRGARNRLLTFKLTVTDSGGLDSPLVFRQGASLISVDLLSLAYGAQPYSASFTPKGPWTLDAGNSLTLTADVAPAGNHTYAWTIGSRPAGITGSGTDTSALTITAPNDAQAGDLGIKLVVTDDAGMEIAFNLAVRVINTNDAPTANAGPDQTVAEGAMVTLDGSASFDLEGEALVYIWTHSNVGITLSDANTVSPTFSAPDQLAVDVMLTFSLVVNDGTTDSPADTVTITVSAGDNDAPTADAGADATVTEGTMVTLDGSASFDPEGEALTYAWTHSNSGITLSESTVAMPTFTVPDTIAAGDRDLTFSLVVTDAAGASSTDTVTITTLDTGLSAESAKKLNEAILPRLVHTMLASTMSALSHRVDAAFSAVLQTASLSLDGQTVRLDSQANLSANLQDMLQGKLPAYIKSLQNDTMDWKQLLSNSSFVMPLNAGGNDGSGSSATVWGAGDYSNLSDKGWKGDVFSIQLGIDGRVGDDLLAGGLVSWSKGDVDYVLDKGGEYTHQITSVHPYMVRSSGNVKLWGSVGYGQGRLEIKQNGDTQRSSDTRLLSLSTGVVSQLLQSGLSLKSDLALAQINIDGSTDNSIASQKLASQRLRLLLEVAKEHHSPSGLFKPVLEVGVRYDGGDGESGVGAVLDFGLHYVCAATGWTVEGKVHTLVGRKDYKEWGVQGQIHKQAGVGGQGLSFSMSPSYGNNDSGADRVWQQQLPAASGGNGNSLGDSARLEVNMGYGLFINGRLLTPYIETTLGKTDSYRFGLRWKNHSRLDMNLFAEEQAGEHKVLLQSRIRF